ncbi:MAG: CBS domain-containing protein [Gemmatimonadales bacterium]
MLTGRICTRVVATAVASEAVRTAAQRMASQGVGTLVVLDPSSHTPTGVVTDRDLTIRCLAQGLDPDATPVAEVMSAPAISITDEAPIEDALEKMSRAGIRRLVVTGADGGLIGLLSLDDTLELVVEEMTAIGRLLERQAPHVAV